ncbi:MAG TPA: hypothetical protein VNW54_00375 [Granulicella sp.]|jgi:hypothetical protein|nr:hypothetical protein [Granulicella sp.]
MDDIKQFPKAIHVAGIGLIGACLPGGQMISATGQDTQAIRSNTQTVKNSYIPVDEKESFAAVHDRMTTAKAGVMKLQMDLLEERYDLSDRPPHRSLLHRQQHARPTPSASTTSTWRTAW